MRYLLKHPANQTIICTVELQDADKDMPGSIVYSGDDWLQELIKREFNNSYTAFGHIANPNSLTTIDFEFIMSNFMQKFQPELIDAGENKEGNERGSQIPDSWSPDIPEEVLT